jgi:hypothetical protein
LAASAMPVLLEAADPVDHVVDVSHSTRAKHSVDLRKAFGRTRPVVQRERAHDDIEARVGKRERGDVAYPKLDPVGHTGPYRQRVSPLDHLG